LLVSDSIKSHQSKRRTMRGYSRRRLVQSMGVAAVGALAGCADRQTQETPTTDGDVAVGANGANRFAPEELTVAVGETVTWTFVGPGHNVSGVPDHSPETSIPEGADPFASYGADGSPNDIEPIDATYEHTFETPGEYTYVCIPHIRTGMIGTVVVEE